MQASTLSHTVARRLLALIVPFGMIVGAGPALRLSMTTQARSYQLAYGEVGAAPRAQAAAPQASNASMATPLESFNGWANNRLREKPGARIQGAIAYDDYEQVCQWNGIEPMSEKKFGDEFTRLVESSHGRFTKAKIGGKMFYQGWELPTAAHAIDAEYQQIEGPR
jgi:hypothetical protein